MAISEVFAGSVTSNTTEWDIASNTSFAGDVQTADGVYQCFLELNNLASGDEWTIRIYEKVQSGSTQRLLYSATINGAQGFPNWVSPSLILMHGWAFTIQKNAGTDRAIAWSIRQVA